MPSSGLRLSAAALALAGLLVPGATLSAAQSAPDEVTVAPPSAPDPAGETTVQAVLPEQLERIKQVLEHEPVLDVRPEHLVFYARVVGRVPMTFAEYAKGYDLMNGPTRRGNPMSHQEFLDLVTPRDLHSSGGITAGELLQFALTNYLGKRLLQLGLDELREAKDEREAREIRDRIERELSIIRASEGKLQ